MSKAPAIGIDIGNTYIRVAIFRNDKLEIIPNDEGKKETPTYISFTSTEEIIGEDALNQINHNLKNTFYDFKKLICRNYNDNEFQDDIQFLPFNIIKDPLYDTPLFQIKFEKRKGNFSPEELYSLILKNIKQNASNYLGKEVKDAIITVPSHFNSIQRKAIKDAGIIAGLNILRILTDPVSASMLYSYKEGLSSKKEKNILVFDLGGGSFDVAITSLEDGLCEIRANEGILNLGGENFNNRIMEYCAKEYEKKTSIDISLCPTALARLRLLCEKAKIDLSSKKQTTIEIYDILSGEQIEITLTREIFENLCKDLFVKCIKTLEKVFEEAKMDKNSIDEIILLGGSTHIPKIRNMLKVFFNGKEPKKIEHPEEDVVFGAAIQAAVITNCKYETIETLVLLDVTCFSFGIEIEGGIMCTMIRKNSTTPTKKTQIFSLNTDYQSSVLIRIYEGENEMVKDNEFIGELILDGIQSKKKGEQEIEITFDLDVNSELTITAVENSTGKSNKIHINFKKGKYDKFKFNENKVTLIQKEEEKEKKKK